jgi:hypothetical protein
VNYFMPLLTILRGRVAQSVYRLATGWTVRGSNPGGARFSAPVQTGPRAHPASCTMGTGSFPGVKSGRGVTLTPHPLLMPWSWKGSAMPLLPLWAVRPVQSLSACTRVHFFTTNYAGQAVTQFAEALRYKPECPRFDSRWRQWNFSYT